MKKTHTISFLLITLSFLIISCNDYSVSPKPPIEIDSADIYNWQVIQYIHPMNGLYVADSNNVFINGINYKPLFYNGDTIKEINLNDPGFEFVMTAGYDKNNVIFGGASIPAVNPVIKKWTNGSITTFTIENDSGYSVNDILMEEPDQAWISSVGKNKVYYFNSGSFTGYMLDDSVEEGRFYRDANRQLYLFGLYVESRNPNPVFKMLYTYKFNNGQFQLISRDSLYPHSDKTEYLLKCGTDMFMITHPDAFDRLFWFNGNNWVYYLDAPEHHTISNVGGISKDYFVLFSGPPRATYVWKGYWRKEDSLKIESLPLLSVGASSIITKDEDVYFTVFDWNNSGSFFVIGKKKNKNRY